MKKIAILGSTGSIGESTLKVIRHLGKEHFAVTAIAAHSNIDLLEKQAHEFNPDIIGVYDKDKARELQKRLPNKKIVGGMEGLEEVASHNNSQFVVSAISGTLGLMPTIAAIKAGKDIGLANKESLVSGGKLVMDLAKQYKVKILPIDSEHSAIFQCLNGENPKQASRIILTASGGPFRHMQKEELAIITVDHALRHPTWSMGKKVTIDCSTLMNKGLEAIEAHWLFDMPIDQIHVVIHPQSIIHSMVEFIDGSMMAQMSETSMIVPIQYALTYPDRMPGIIKPFDFNKYATLQFFEPDVERFRCLDLAFEAMRKGGSLSCYMNAANEVLVNRFIEKEISWLDIGHMLEKLMSNHSIQKIHTIQDVLDIDSQAREEAFAASL